MLCAAPAYLKRHGALHADDPEVLTDWMLAGHGIASRQLFDVALLIASGRLIKALPQVPPQPSLFGWLYSHRQWQDPKVCLLVDFMVEQSQKRIGAAQ